MHKISIISVTFNNLKGLIKTCESINEFFRSPVDGVWLEHVVVDGGSTDGSRNFLLMLSLVPKNILLRYISEPDRGIYDAMNKGVGLSEGDYVVFLNAGDEISSSFRLSRLIQDLLHDSDSHNSAGLAYSAFVNYGLGRGRMLTARQVIIKNPRMPTVHQSIFYRRSVLLKYDFNTEFLICGDYENFSRILVDGLTFRPISEVFSIFCSDGVSSRSPVRLFFESSRITWGIASLGCLLKIKVTIRLAISIFIHTLWVFSSKRA